MVFSLLGRMPLHQLFVVTLVGVTSGVYIYRPLLERYANEHGLKNNQKEESTTTVAAADDIEVKSSAPTQKQEDVTGVQQKESVENTPEKSMVPH